MDDFERRLASRLSAYERSVPLTDAPAVAPRHVPTTWAWAGIAGVLVLAVTVGLVGSRLLTGVRPSGDGVVTSLSWESYRFVEGATVADVAAVGNRLIATGGLSIGADGDQQMPAAWYSDDGGIEWNAASVQNPRSPSPGTQHGVGSIVQGNGLLLATDVYVYASNTFAASDAVWTSTDNGVTWELVGAIAGTPRAVAAAEDRFVAIGTDQNRNVVSWQSEDGRVWVPVGISGIDDGAYISDLAFGGDQLIAVGSQQPTDESGPTPTAWTSVDGRTWTASPIDSHAKGGAMTVQVSEAGAVVTGDTDAEGTSIPTLWRSGPNRSWTSEAIRPSTSWPAYAGDITSNSLGELVRLTTTARIPPGLVGDELWFVPSGARDFASDQQLHETVSAIAALPDRFIAISVCKGDYLPCTATVSIGTPASSDATPAVEPSSESQAPTSSGTLSPAPSPASPSPTASPTAIDPRRDVSIIDQAPESYVSALVTTETRQFAVGRRDNHAAIWTSSDFDTWSRVEPPPPAVADWPGTVNLRDAAVRGDTIVAVGAQYNVDYGRPLILVSNGGDEWQSATLPDPETCASIETVVATATGFIAGGALCPTAEETQTAAIWVSADGLEWHRASVADAAGGAIVDIAYSLQWPDRIVAVGSVSESSESHARAWGSSDDEKWEALWSVSDPSSFESIAAVDNDLYVGGYIGSFRSHKPAVWHLTAGGPASVDIPGLDCCGSVASMATDGHGVMAVVTPSDPAGGMPQYLYGSVERGWNVARTLVDRLVMRQIVQTTFGPVVIGTLDTWDGVPVAHSLPVVDIGP